MIRCNLAVLLAERNLKISKVSEDTGISRTTLTALGANYSKGIQFETLNTLCAYLKTTPEKLISFCPVNFKKISANFTDLSRNDRFKSCYTIVLDISIQINNLTTPCSMVGTFYPHFDNNVLKYFEVYFELWEEEGDPDIIRENRILKEAFQLLSRPFLEDIKNEIESAILYEVEHYYPSTKSQESTEDNDDEDVMDVYISYPDELIPKE